MGAAAKINLYQAVDRMKEISVAGGTFSLKFRKWNRATHDGGDLCVVPRARIRQKTSDEKIANASHKVFFTDTSTGRARNCWQCLIVEFNGRKVTF